MMTLFLVLDIYEKSISFQSIHKSVLPYEKRRKSTINKKNFGVRVKDRRFYMTSHLKENNICNIIFDSPIVSLIKARTVSHLI